MKIQILIDSAAKFFMNVISAICYYIKDFYAETTDRLRNIINHLLGKTSPCDQIEAVTLTTRVYKNKTAITAINHTVLPTEISRSATEAVNLMPQAYKDNTAITSINLEAPLTWIGCSAFENCTNLNSIELPITLTEIEQYAFNNCTSLNSIELPDHITIIDRFVFHCCTSLRVIKFPATLTRIESDAFRYCTSLTSIDLPDSLTEIGSGSFQDCTSLSSVRLPGSLTEIKSFAFDECTSLTSITIPDKVRSIGTSTFAECNLAYIVTNHQFDWNDIGIDTERTAILTYKQHLEQNCPSLIEHISLKNPDPCEAYLIYRMHNEPDYLPDWVKLKNTFKSRSITQVHDLLLQLGRNIVAINATIPNREIAFASQSFNLRHPIFEYMSIKECDNLFEGTQLIYKGLSTSRVKQ